MSTLTTTASAPVFKIERGVPIPANIGRGRKRIYPFRELQVKNSFVAPLSREWSLRNCAVRYGNLLRRQFTVSRVVEKGEQVVRVWRTA